MPLQGLENLKAILPELCLTAGILAVLAVDQILSPDSRARRAWVVGVSLAVLFLSGIAVSFTISRDGETLAFGSMYTVDGFTCFFRLLFLGIGAIVVALSYGSKEVDRRHEGEFYSFVLASTLATCLLAGSVNLLMIFLSLEFLSLTSYILTALKRGDRRSSEAALKYVLYGAMASGITLFGFSYLYGLTGHLDLAAVGQGIVQLTGSSGPLEKGLLSLVLIACFVALGFKMASVPFHMWCPDVYEGAPTPVTALLSVGPKAAGFAVFLRLFSEVFGDPAIAWPGLIAVLSAASMTVGNLAAFGQGNVKRLLAYSSIAQTGYILMGVAAFSSEGIASVLFYLAVYALMNLGAFGVVMAVREQTGREDMDAYRGLSGRSPALAVALSIFLFSLVGLPPLAGFVGKFALFAAVIKMGTIGYVLLAVIGVLNSAVSLYYYARILRAMFFQEQEEDLSLTACPAIFPLVSFLLAAAVIVLGLWWSPLMEWARASVLPAG